MGEREREREYCFKLHYYSSILAYYRPSPNFRSSDMDQMKDRSFFCSILSLVLTFSYFAASDDQFVYHGFAGVNNLTLDGNALITPDGLLELTNDRVNLGHAFYPTPLNFHQQLNGTVQSFSISFVFAILSVHADISADGMAFFVAPTKNLSNTWAQYIGLLNSGNDGNASNHTCSLSSLIQPKTMSSRTSTTTMWASTSIVSPLCKPITLDTTRIRVVSSIT